MKQQLYIGLLSGTSMDGIDAAVFDFAADQKLLGSYQHSLPPALSEILWELIAQDNIADPRIAYVDEQLAYVFAEAVQILLLDANLKPEHIMAIGSHGQNISHHPNDIKPYTLQIGNPQIIADATRIMTVGDFRSADIAAGGQGAPLAPLLHKQFLQQPNTKRAIVNIGGIANVSFVTDKKPVIGFDTGPGNGLLDAWIKLQRQQTYDRDGAFAASGTVDTELLARLLADPYFKQRGPKSTGKEYFNLAWLTPFLADQKAEDIQATLVELTVQSILQAIQQHWPVCEIVLCGGGVHNRYLMQRLQQSTSNKVFTTTDLGFDGDYLEAMLFAWLAKMRIENCKLDTRKITGAKKPLFLGEIYTPSILTQSFKYR